MSVVYQGRKPTNLQVSLGASAAQFQASPNERWKDSVQRQDCPIQAKPGLGWASRPVGPRFARQAPGRPLMDGDSEWGETHRDGSHDSIGRGVDD
jgi:hypothetical protein